jgi:hypothetical protein
LKKPWGNTSNPLRLLSLDKNKNGSVCFTELSENKIGFLDAEKLRNLPIWLAIQELDISINKEKDMGLREVSQYKLLFILIEYLLITSSRNTEIIESGVSIEGYS